MPIMFHKLLYGLIISATIYSCKSESEKSNHTKDFCASIHTNDTSTIKDYLMALDAQLSNSSGAYVLEDGDGSMIARAWLTEHAEKSIDIQYFIFSVDNVGLIACDYLVRAADRGVKVRILIDDIMVDADADDIKVLDAHPNIDIKIYNPGTNLGKNIFQKIEKIATDFKGINQRMHNKTFIADGMTVITGGRNIADEYFDYDHEYNFRDRDIFLLGKVVNDINRSFESFWNYPLSLPVSSLISQVSPSFNRAIAYEKLHQYACDPTNYWPQVRSRVVGIPKAFQEIAASGDLIWSDSIYFLSDDPGKNKSDKSLSAGGKSTDELINLVNSARYNIDIQSPYLITTALSRKLFKQATDRGVKIRILTNSLLSTDNLEAFSGYQRDRQKLLATGVRIFEFRPDAACRYHVMTGALQKKLDYTPTFGLHAKTMIIDGKIAVIGTFNLDPRSAHLNTECITIVYSEKLAKGVLKGIEEEFAPENAWETTKEWNPDHQAGLKKRTGVFARKIVPKSIL